MELHNARGRDTVVTEKFAGKGKVYKGDKFIADVEYELSIISQRKFTRTFTSEGPYSLEQDVKLHINPATEISEQFGLDRLTLHMSDGRKQDFFVSSDTGECQATGGPHK